jgi:Flp pilus assembly protein TadD
MILGYCGAACFLISGSAFAQDAEAGFNQALQAFRAGDRQKAVTVLEAVLKAHPDHAPSHELLGLSLAALGESSGALSHLREAVKLWPDQPVYWTNLAIFYLRQSRTDEAEKALKQSLEVEPSPPAFRLLGLIRLDQNWGEEAVQLFQKALDLAPDDVESWYYLGLAHQSLAQNDSALSCYQEALRRSPRDSYVHFQLGILYLTRGLRKQALDHLQIAKETRPNAPEVHQRLTQAYLASGEFAAALESARRAVELSPNDRQAHYQLALALARLGKTEESTKEFQISEGLPKKGEPSPLEAWRKMFDRAWGPSAAKP